MSNEHFEELKHTGNLPSPSGVGMRILVLTRDEECEIEEIARAIQADPALTGRIIKLATSVQSQGIAGSVTTVKEAAVRLGLRTVTNVALGFSLVSGNRVGRCERFDYDAYWSWSLACAVSAQILSEELGIGHPAETFTCGLLSRIGRLALASVHPTTYARLLDEVEKTSIDLALAERREFSVDNRWVAGAMLDDWGLPTAFGEVASALDERAPHFEDPSSYELLRLLRAAGAVAEVCSTHTEGQPGHLEALRRVCKELEIPAAVFCRAFDRIVLSWKEWGEVLAITTNEVMGFEELERRAQEAEAQTAALPSATGATSGASAMKAPLGSRLRILAVDDDQVSLKLLVKQLSRAGHLVVTASNGKEALAVALQTNPQIVVTDWMMPEMDGLELCKALRRIRTGRNLYILILTGRAEEDRVVEAFEAGVDDYVVKPFKPKLLLARIRGGERVVRLQERVERYIETQKEQLAKLEVQRRKLKTAAMTDALTELPNRRYAMRRLEVEWANCNRSGAPLSVIMLDIDKFKSINDGFGHAVGDVVLQATARAVVQTLRKGDICARIGGEEFLVICPATDGEGAMQAAERIRMAIESNRIVAGDFDGVVTASLGVASWTDEIESIDVLLRVSDEAVYEAKAQGRNQTVPGRPTDRRRSA